MQMGGSVERHKRKPAVGWELILVLAVSAAALLPGVGLPGLGGLPVVDRDEARFAQASRQMLESSTLEGWIVPRVGDRPRLNKPPLIYWMQSGVAWVATGGDPSMDRIWMYRLPSVLAALFAAGLTWWLGRRMFGPGPGISCSAQTVGHVRSSTPISAATLGAKKTRPPTATAPEYL